MNLRDTVQQGSQPMCTGIHQWILVAKSWNSDRMYMKQPLLSQNTNWVRMRCRHLMHQRSQMDTH